MPPSGVVARASARAGSGIGEVRDRARNGSDSPRSPGRAGFADGSTGWFAADWFGKYASAKATRCGRIGEPCRLLLGKHVVGDRLLIHSVLRESKARAVPRQAAWGNHLTEATEFVTTLPRGPAKLLARPGLLYRHTSRLSMSSFGTSLPFGGKVWKMGVRKMEEQ